MIKRKESVFRNEPTDRIRPLYRSGDIHEVLMDGRWQIIRNITCRENMITIHTRYSQYCLPIYGDDARDVTVR